MNIRYPLTAVGDEGPTNGRLTWVVRLRNPLLLAQVEPMVVGLRLHCWPYHAHPQRLKSAAKKLAELYCEEVEEWPGLPSRWDYVFRDGFAAPPFLMLDNARSEWSGVLRTEPLQLWHVIESGAGIGLVWDPDFGNGGGVFRREPTEAECDEAVGWWARYCDAEDALDAE